MSDDDYPYARPWKDRHGRLRWRFRRGEKTIYLPGIPGEAAFEDAYHAAIAGLSAPKNAEIVKHPGATVPRSMRAAWRSYMANAPEWAGMEPDTRSRQQRIAEAFLTEPVAKGATAIWGDMPIADLKRRHLKAIISAMAATPHAARHRLTVIRKMIVAALDEEWIEADPSHKLAYKPKTTVGWRAWTEDEMLAFEKRWPVGTTPRLVYELGLWLGPRRCDIARLTPQNIVGDLMIWTPRKTRKTGLEARMPITPAVRAVLDATDLSGETIVRTAAGAPFSIKSLTGRMRDWTASAGLSGTTLHGLRKTLGKRVAEAEGTTKQSQAVLAHETLQQAELYAKDAERERLARDAMTKVVTMVDKRRAQKEG
jgi:integrase